MALPALLLLMLVLWTVDLRQAYVAPGLTLALQFVFLTLASVLVGYLASRSFLSNGSLAPLLLVCGILLWGLAGVAARTAGAANFNGSVTIHNTLTWLAAWCHLLGAGMTATPTVAAHRRVGWLLVAYAATGLGLLLVVRAALEGWTPVFFVQGEGGTVVRQVVLTSAIAMLAVSALLLLFKHRAVGSEFSLWYAQGLALAAAGLFGVLISKVHSGALNWAGVLTQCLSGVYFVAAAFAAFREAGGQGVSLAAAPSAPGLRYALAVMFVAAALALRMVFDEALGGRTLYVTFFPAVILAALYGGLGPGLVAIALSSLCIDYFFVEPVWSLTIGTTADQVAIMLFTASSLLMVWITGLMQHSQARVAVAETDLRLAAERRRALEDTDRAKDEFLAMLSHELRNPLAALTSASHVLRVGDPSGTAAEQARGVIERQTAHMAHLVEDLLDVSRVAMGKVALSRQAFDLGEMASGVVEGWRAAGRLAKPGRVVVRASPAWVEADRVRMEQVLSNLLDNAVKFTPAGGAITVSVRADGDEAVLTVADTGRGIPPDLLPQIFVPFVQGEQALDRQPGGLGIGLALVKRLVELHGGSVAAASGGEGQGATFTLRLPGAQAPRLGHPAARKGKRTGPRRVLLIEDNEDARQMLRAALALDGHEVREAANAAAGIAAAADSWPDVALVDIGLPDMDGYEVARRLRRNGGLHLIAITGYGQPRDEARARDAGFDAHLVKPVGPERLNQIIAELT